MVTFIFRMANGRYDNRNKAVQRPGESFVGKIIEAGFGSDKHYIPSGSDWTSPHLPTGSDGAFTDFDKARKALIAEYERLHPSA